MLKLCPEIASIWVVPVWVKSSWTDDGILARMPRRMPWANDACGSGKTAERVWDRRVLNE